MHANHSKNTDFARDVDRLLHEAGRTGAGPEDADYRADLLLAAELAAADFSDESRNRVSLRRELISRSRERRAWAWRQAPALATIATIVLLAGVVVAAQPVLRFLERIFVGARTVAVIAEPPGEAELDEILAERARELESGVRWTTRTAVSTIGGDVPAGREPVIRTYNSLGRAESAVTFSLMKPERLPEGFRFDRAVIPPDGSVILWYTRPGERITLHQGPIRPDSYTMTMSMGGDASLQALKIDGEPAAWTARKLVWEADGRRYTLEGTHLEREEAVEIALSLCSSTHGSSRLM